MKPIMLILLGEITLESLRNTDLYHVMEIEKYYIYHAGGVIQLSTSNSSVISSSVEPIYYASWISLGLVLLILLVTSVPVFFRCGNKSWRKIKKYGTVLLYTLFTTIPLKRGKCDLQND